MLDKILFVDDEPAVLQGYQRLLHTDFKVITSVGGPVGLLLLQRLGPFAVVVSDMRMPGMDGIEFLLKVKSLAPDTVRMMLTGQSDLETAVNAVNEGNIFRFLCKPSNKETLVKSLTDGVAQYRLVCAEKELLEKTLRGTVHVLTEVLSLVSPAAFSRATRVRRYVHHVATKLSLGSLWRFEVAAMMSQLGCVTLDPHTIEVIYTGGELTPEEQAQYVNHPLVTRDLLKNIPRLESIAWMITYQNRPLPAEWDVNNREMRLGAQILSAALMFDRLLRKRHSRVEAAHYLTRKFEGLDNIIEALMELEPEVAGQGTQTVCIADLSAGMILEQEVRTKTGLLVAAKGQEVTPLLLLKLKSYSGEGAIADEVAASTPKFAQ
jgi:response regulator RpfG family c-di-GMP phosphodiesterase